MAIVVKTEIVCDECYDELHGNEVYVNHDDTHQVSAQDMIMLAIDFDWEITDSGIYCWKCKVLASE